MRGDSKVAQKIIATVVALIVMLSVSIEIRGFFVLQLTGLFVPEW